MGIVIQATPAANLHRSILIGLFLLIIGLGGWFSIDARNREDANLRRELLRQASNVAATISLEDIRELSFTTDDADRPAFQRISTHLRAYAEATGTCSLYTMRLRDGKIFFGPESLLPGDSYATPPGTSYLSPSPHNFDVFRTTESVVFGPVSDEFGEFVSANVPIIDPRSGEVLMVLGQDVEAAHWRERVRIAQWIPLWAMLLPMGLLLLGYAVYKKRKMSGTCDTPSLCNIQIATHLAVLLLLTLSATLFVRNLEVKNRKDHFLSLVEIKSRYYTETFNRIHRDLQLLSGFFESSENVTREEFSTFCTPLLESSPIQSCLWLPSSLTADSPGPHYPAVYVEPTSMQPSILGYDFYSDPILRNALLEAVEPGTIIASETPSSTAPSGRPASLYVFEPVTHPRTGFLGISIEPDKLVDSENLNPEAEVSDLATTLFALHAGKEPQPLSCSTCEHDADHCREMLHSDLSATIPVFAFGKPYLLLFTPEPQWLAANQNNGAWATLATGVVLTLLLTYLFSILLNRPLLLEKMVQQRTRELAELQERCDIATSAAGIGIWERDVAKDRLIWDERMYQLYGLNTESFDGTYHAWCQCIHPDDRESATSEIAAAEIAATKQGKNVFNTEFRIVRPDGEIRHIQSVGRVVHADGGKTSKVTGVNLDITDLKNAHHAAAKEQERLKFIFDALPIGISLNRTYSDGRESRMINDAHLRIAGISRDQDNPEVWRRINHPDNPDEQDAIIHETDGGRIKHFTVDKRYVHQDGRIVWIAFSRRRKILDDGGFEDLCSAVDITERKEAEEDLRESEERYRSTLNDLQVGVIVHAEDTRILLSNPEASRILGLSAEQLAGRAISDPIWKFIRADGSAMPVEEFPVNRVMSTGKSVFNQIAGIMVPGQAEPTWVTANAVRVVSDNSYLLRIIVNFMDITEQINTELQLKARNNELERFNKVTIGRELRMVELKKEINALCRKLGKPAAYAVDLDRDVNQEPLR